MDFAYEIIFMYEGVEARRIGHGLFYPHDGGFNLEHMLWLMTEHYGRPESIQVNMIFGGRNGENETKRIEAPSPKAQRKACVPH